MNIWIVFSSKCSTHLEILGGGGDGEDGGGEEGREGSVGEGKEWKCEGAR